MSSAIYVDVHVIQTVPPANINRDDAGSPKQAMFGGVLRGRVSSQAWKRAARRELMEQGYDRQVLGVRTDMAPFMLKNSLMDKGLSEEDAERCAVAAREAWGIKPGKASEKAAVSEQLKTAYLLFLAREQVDRMADLVLTLDEIPDDAGELAKAMKSLDFGGVLGTGHSVDVALFGRMVADRASWNVDASTQVAHAISTHGIDVEFDYYTAVDDENAADETGAGMIGTIEFNSATLYRYANIGVHQLLENLEGDVEAVMAALGAFVKSFAFSMPTGHQNSFGHRTVPQLVALVVRQGQPVNLVTAFEAPVAADAHGGIAMNSVLRLDRELAGMSEQWGLVPASVKATYVGALDCENLGASQPFASAVSDTVAVVRSLLEDA